MIKAPFPYFGGKSKVAGEVWRRFGDVRNYVEPFFGSGAVMLARPKQLNGIVETANDANGFIANFWRAVQHDPDTVAYWADWPVSELDLHARHRWLVNQHDFIESMRDNPDYFDAKIAGWWIWGISQWIGSGWCNIDKSKGNQRPHLSRPHLSNRGMGIHQEKPHLSDAGMGIHKKRPQLATAGKGINAMHRRESIMGIMRSLQQRLRNVRVCCGDWSRVLGSSVTFAGHGLTGIFLDPPYTHNERDKRCYAVEMDCADAVRDWAINNGDNPLMRIALCGYEGEHVMPDSWHEYAWKATGGYGSQGNNKAKENANRERIWFSPHCIEPSRQIDLFGDAA